MKVSVIIPTYNREKEIVTAIQSVLGQTYQNIEILVCDDGSTDGTAEAVLAIKDKRVKWIPANENSGLPAVPRNRGIKEARGEWIAFLDSDDVWLPDKLEKQMDRVKKGARVVCSNAKRKLPCGDIEDRLLKEVPRIISFEDLLEGNKIICSSVLVEKQLIIEAGGFPEDVILKAGEDYALWLRVATHTSFEYIEDPLLVYTDDPSVSVRGFQKDWHMALLLQEMRVLRNFVRWAKKSKISNEVVTRAEKQYKVKRYDKIKHTVYMKKHAFAQTMIGRKIRKIFRKYRGNIQVHGIPSKGHFEVDNWDISNFIVKKVVPIAGIHPFPLNELSLMVATVAGVKPTHIFEWGTHIGKSARIFYEASKACGLDTEIHSIDLPDDVSHGEHPYRNRGRMVRDIKEVYLHQGDGLAVSKEIAGKLDENARILFFVDGDHEYGSVKRELEYIIAHFPDAAILLHDTFYQVAGAEYNVGPYRAIRDVLSSRENEYERIDTKTGLPGMTLLYKRSIFK